MPTERITLKEFIDEIVMEDTGYKDYEEYRAAGSNILDGKYFTQLLAMNDFINVAPYQIQIISPNSKYPIRYAKDLEEGKRLFDEICNINKLGREDVYALVNANRIMLEKYEYNNDGKVISNEIVKELDNNVLANLKDECIERKLLLEKTEMALKVGNRYLSIIRRGDNDWKYKIYNENYILKDDGIIDDFRVYDNTIIEIAKDIIENEESFKRDGITYADSEEIDYYDLEYMADTYESECENNPLIKNNEYESEIEDKAGAEKRANLFEGIKTGIVSKMKKSFAKKEKEYEEEL